MKKIVFLSGTRADYGKIKRIMKLVDSSPEFELYVFVTGMHMQDTYGSTYREIQKDGYSNIWLYINQLGNTDMDITLAQTVSGFGAYIKEIKPDMVVVHGDRLEALSGAIVAVMNNILLAHIEGGEVSGTIDESLRHAISKLSHIHFVSNADAKNRLIQLGEISNNIHIIGSPDIDIMLNENLPKWSEVNKRYDIQFDDYAIALFHPVTTDYVNMCKYSVNFADALLESGENYIVIQPNNDLGREYISHEYQKLTVDRFKIFPSMRFEHFLVALKNARFIIGNSSAGIREAGVYGIPSIDIGDRQKGRYKANSGIIHCGYEKNDILNAVCSVRKFAHTEPQMLFGKGNSAEKFIEVIKGSEFWNTPIQKHFIDLD